MFFDPSKPASSFARLEPKHAPVKRGQHQHQVQRGQHASRRSNEPILFEREKKTHQLLPAWDEEGNKNKVMSSLRKQNRAESVVGITEFLHQDIRRYDKVCGPMTTEPRFELAPRPLGSIGLSVDDVFVRTLPSNAVEEQDAHQQQEPDQQQPNQLSTTPASSSSSMLMKSEIHEPQIVETSHGLEIAPVPEHHREKKVFFCRIAVSAGTTPGAIVEYFKNKVQSARHRLVGRVRDDFVPCDVRIEPCSGFAVAPVAAAMEMNVRVRTWKAAGDEVLRKQAEQRPQVEEGIKNGATLRLMQVWDLSEYRRVMAGRSCGEFLAAATDDAEGSDLPSLPPLIEYSVLVRGSESSLASVLDQCRRVRDSGFINYPSLFSFGRTLGSGRLPFAHAYLNGRWTDCVLAHAACLAHSSPVSSVAIQKLAERLEILEKQNEQQQQQKQQASSLAPEPKSGGRKKTPSAFTDRNLEFEWRTAQQTVEGDLEDLKHVCRISHARADDVDLESLYKLNELLQHVVSVGGDCKSIVLDPAGSAVLPRTVVNWHLRSLSDVHFSTMASMRVRRYGCDRVVPGDVVCVDRRLLPKLDYTPESMVPSFTVPCHYSLTYDRRTGDPPVEARYLSELVRVVQSDREAAQYDISQVVLPRWPFLNNNSNNSTDQPLPFPHLAGIDRSSFIAVADSLGIATAANKDNDDADAMPLSNVAPSYRPLLVRPRWLHAHSWDDRVEADCSLLGSEHAAGLDTVIDGEGVRRLCAGVFATKDNKSSTKKTATTTKIPIIRPAIKAGPNCGPARAALMASVAGTGGSKAICTALRIALPATASLTSALREIFRADFIEPRDVTQLVRKSVEDSWRRRGGKLAAADRGRQRRAERFTMEL